MKRHEVYNCLLCNAPLKQQITWQTLFTNAFPKTICADCEEKFEPYENTEPEITSLYHYNNFMKDFLHRYKFMHDVLLAKVFRDQIHQQLSKTKATIVPIPMHPQKQKERTFAHIDELLKQANISYTHYLEKITTETQVGKTRMERISTPQIFKLKRNATDIKDKEFLLVDDIYTTGTTMKHAKRLLLAEGAKSVQAFTLIRG